MCCTLYTLNFTNYNLKPLGFLGSHNKDGHVAWGHWERGLAHLALSPFSQCCIIRVVIHIEQLLGFRNSGISSF